MSCAHPGMKENRDLASFFVTKHSWRGKYKRILSVGTMGITTYNPQQLEITNQWLYQEIINIGPNVKAPTNNEFILTMKRGPKKVDTMRFSTEHRADVLTEALRFASQFCDREGKNKRFNASKYHWSENRVPVILRVSPGSLDQLDPATGRQLCSYDYKDMEGMAQVSDYPGGLALIYGGFSRLHLFALDQMDELIKSVQASAANDVGISIKLRKEPITLDQFLEHKFGKYSTDEALTSYAEFTVQKLNARGSRDSVRRTLCLTETCLLERDPGTYNVVTVRPLCDVFALIRDQENPQQFCVEYVKGAVRNYASTDRDALLASILDGVRASGNRDVCVKMAGTDRGMRLGPFTVPVDEEVETQHLKFLQQPPEGLTFTDCVSRFNANIPYCGLLHAVTQEGLFAENKERMIHATLSALLDRQGDQNAITTVNLEAQFHALRRLVASKAGFQAFTVLPKMRESVGIKVVKALKRNDDGVTHAAVDMLNALMQPMHDDYDLAREQLNKASLMSSKTFMENLLNVLKNHVVRGSGALVISVMLDFLTFALCAPYSETTDGAYFDNLLEMVAKDGRIIYRLFEHPSTAIVKGAGLVMKAIIEEGETEIAERMQDLALAEGALPRHLHIAMFTLTTDSRMLTNRQLSRHLVGLWVTGHSTATALLKRIIPAGLMQYLESSDEVPADDQDRINVRDNLVMAQEHHSRNKRNLNPHIRKIERMIEKKLEYVMVHWRERIGLERKQAQQSDKPIVLRKRRQKIKSEANWKLFYYHFNKDHSIPNLIWNYKTREELRECLEQEMRSFSNDKDLSSSAVISWNHDEFEVPYNCLADEIRIGEYYLRLLMEEDQNEEVTAIKRSPEFFNDLYHRFLLTSKLPMKCMCLQTMAIVYGRCYEEIGPFNDTKFIVGMLERCMDRLERDRLIIFISKLVYHKRNAKELIDAKGLRSLVDLLTLAHLHVQRAHVPLQSNVIEASPDMKCDGEREWYYGNQAKERLGPHSFAEIKELYAEGKVTAKSRCWSQGMDGWRPLISVPQLKWTLLATGQAVLNESDLAILIMNILIRVCEYYPSRDSDNAVIRPLPRAKRDLSEPICLPHIVQLLLTFDPILVEKVATFLNLVMVDNPSVTRAYLTGVFFFILMYTGSNVLPIVQFLKYAHLEQAFRSDDYVSNDVMARSILSHVLPDAMVHFLENHSSEKFAEIFLGEFDTPEAIWSREMRRLMIEKIASHLADFSPRLPSNTRALYQYCPIPHIIYPQLENELFCNIYYLRHLCDMTRFPDWPIAEPVKLLKDILEAWKKEVEKKPPDLTIQDAYDVLGIKMEQKDVNESSVRKAYFKVAQRYHPDKNPEGREMFEKVNKAYEFLCSRSRLSDGPDPQNILLIIKAQCILFHRYRDILHPYKYSGYPMLIKTIRMETADEHLFGKKVPLLSASSELCYHTVNCSALNAEELRRENGIEALQAAFSRCIGIISRSTKPEELCVQVCREVVRCYTVAAQFEGCRERILEQPNIVKDVCRTLYFRQLKKMCVSVSECVGAFAVDFWLQTNLFQAGVLWHLIPLLFEYDFTLEEGGVSSSEDSNKQEVSNRLAKLSLVAITRLAGFSPTQSPKHQQQKPASSAAQTPSEGTPQAPPAPPEVPTQGPLAPIHTPDNPAIQKSVSALLTSYLSRKMANYEISEVLKILNSNTESPYLLWNNGTRGELLNFVEDQLQNKLGSGESDPSYGADFMFSDHSKELIIGDIFVRIYNEQPAFPLENPKGFAIDLLEYLGSQAQYLHSLVSLSATNGDLMATPNLMTSPNLMMTSQAPDCKNRLVAVKMALEALRNVINANTGVEIQCIGHFKLLFSLLRLSGCCDIQQCALEVISVVSKNQECVSDIAASDVLVYLLLALQTLPNSQLLTLETLYPLISNTKIVKEALNKGALIYLLDLYCNATDPGVRAQTAEVFTKILSDKLVGPKVRIVLSKFLPGIFMDAMRDNAQASVHMFEGTHENPELIWNDDSREKVSLLVRKMKDNHFHKQCENPDVRWHLPEDFAVVYTDVSGELVVGGVFLRLFIASPGWVLRRPKEFMVELLDRWMALAASSNPHVDVLETVSVALGSLFRAQPGLLDQLPQLGHLPKFFHAMSSRNVNVVNHAVNLVREITENKTCLRCVAGIECIGPIKLAIKQCKECISKACEALHNLFNTGDDELVQQALKCDLIGLLLELLNGRLEVLANPAATKAQIVKALKAMQKSLQYGQEVCNILGTSTVWNEYKDQKHDLFISDTPVSGYLTNAPGVAGYLTATSAQSRNLPTSPPPVDKEF